MSDESQLLEVAALRQRIAELEHLLIEHDSTKQALQRRISEVYDLYNKAPCGYHSLDANGVYLEINDVELAWLGYTREEVVGKLRFAEVITEDSLKTFRANFPTFMERGWVKDLEFTVKRRDGTRMSVLLSSTAIRDDSGRFWMSRSTLFDITERKQAEDTLRRSEAKFRTLWNILPDTVLHLDANVLLVDLKASLDTQTLVVPGSASGHSARSVLPAALCERVLAAARQAHAERQQQQFEYQQETDDRAQTYEVRVVDSESGETLVILRDITARKQADEALRRNALLQQEVIATQAKALVELSSPLLVVSDHVVVLPLIGSLDAQRAQHMLQVLLDGIVAQRARVAIVDVTGAGAVDSVMAGALLRAPQAVRLLGARLVVTGLRPDMAQALVTLGADLSSLITYGTLQSGIAYATSAALC